MAARKIELSLNNRVRKLAYDYISKGSFWEFLGAVNKDYERYNEQRVREEKLAASFIHQVLKTREQQQEAAYGVAQPLARFWGHDCGLRLTFWISQRSPTPSPKC